MITINPECYPCFLRQVETACRMARLGETATMKSLKRAARYISTIDGGSVPADVATALHGIVRETGGVNDPFEEIKNEHKKRFAHLLSLVREMGANAGDDLEQFLLFSGAGNMFDFGLISPEEAEGFLKGMGTLSKGVFEIDPLLDDLRSSQVVGILLDNTGETPFDLVLAERLQERGIDVWLGVKGGPVIDDITYLDALDLGLIEKFPVISNGSQAVGTDLADSSPEFLEMLKASDLLISKGQANFETLYGKLEKCYYLFVCKCPVVEKATGADFGSIMLMADGITHEADGSGRFSQFRFDKE